MRILGLDIGGANIKAAWSDEMDTSKIICRSLPFVLTRAPWELPGHIACLMREAQQQNKIDHIAITMTAELCDCFSSKREGVDAILLAVESAAKNQAISVWSTDGKFISPQMARADFMRVSAANWHALATWIAKEYSCDRRSLLIDMGSTTTDLIALDHGKVVAHGLTDTQRLASGELVYLGATCTPLMALGPQIVWNQTTTNIMAEPFATIGDVHVFLGNIPEKPADCDTPDGRPMTRSASAARIARMIGADATLLDESQITLLAEAFTKSHEQRLRSAIKKIINQHSPERIILAGSGSCILSRFDLLNDFEKIDLTEKIGAQHSAAACAWALVMLRKTFSP